MYRVDDNKEVDKNKNGVRRTLLRVLEISQDFGFGPDSCHTKSRHITLSLYLSSLALQSDSCESSVKVP